MGRRVDAAWSVVEEGVGESSGLDAFTSIILGASANRLRHEFLQAYLPLDLCAGKQKELPAAALWTQSNAQA